MSKYSSKIRKAMRAVKEGRELGFVFQQGKFQKGRMIVAADGQLYFNFISADYLDLNTHPRIEKAYIDACQSSGFFNYASVAFIKPTSQKILEDRIGCFLGMGINLFQSVTTLHNAVLPVLAAKYGHLHIDANSHHSVFQATKAIPEKNISIYPSQDLEQLQKNLIEHPQSLVITDGVFSVTGDIADTKQLEDLCVEFDASLYIDDSHGYGTLNQGKGLSQSVSKCPFYYVASMSKSAGCPVAFIGSSTPEEIECAAVNSFFTTGLQEPVLVAALEAQNIIESSEGNLLRDKLYNNTRQIGTAFGQRGWPVTTNNYGIVSITLQERELAKYLLDKLWQAQIWPGLLSFPATKPFQYTVRLCTSAISLPFEPPVKPLTLDRIAGDTR